MEFENAADLKLMSFAIFIRITYQGVMENVKTNVSLSLIHQHQDIPPYVMETNISVEL